MMVYSAVVIINYLNILEKLYLIKVESIINQKGWDFDKLKWVKSHSQGHIMKKMDVFKDVWMDNYKKLILTHINGLKNKFIRKCKSNCQKSNYGGFTYSVYKDLLKPYGGGR